jgi:hypothetical protein
MNSSGASSARYTNTNALTARKGSRISKKIHDGSRPSATMRGYALPRITRRFTWSTRPVDHSAASRAVFAGPVR